MSDLYQEVILDHYQHPRNFGELVGADIEISEANASCGDEVKVALKLVDKDGEKYVEDIKFEGSGCAISMAATSMLTEKVLESKLSLREWAEIGEQKMFELLGVEVGPVRLKCLMLPVRALKKAFLVQMEKS